jgi:hypothetical protein
MSQNESVISDDYKELLNERFNRLNEKIDELKEITETKASSTFVEGLDKRLRTVEESHTPYATVQQITKDFNKFKEEEFKPVKEATEPAVFYHKYPKQLKMMLIGAAVLVLIGLLSMGTSVLVIRRAAKEIAKPNPLTEQTKIP